jgi:hypothetical protein
MITLSISSADDVVFTSRGKPGAKGTASFEDSSVTPASLSAFYLSSSALI